MTTSDWIGGSGDWSDAADWSNGVPNDGGAVANLSGSNAYTVTIAGPLDGGSTESFTVGTLDITDPNAALNIDGTLTVASEIDISAGTLSLAGTIIGGTIKQTGGTIVFSHTSPDWTGTLDGVTVQGTLDLSANQAAINIEDGLSVTGAYGAAQGTVNMRGSGSTLNFYGTQTFNDATIDIGGTGYSSYLNAWDENGAPATLTLGPSVNIVTTGVNGTSTLGGSADATIINQGTITAETSFSHLTIDGPAFINEGTIDLNNGASMVVEASAFSNTGTINVGERTTLELVGTLVGKKLGNIDVNNGFVWIKGTLNNSGHVLAIGFGTALGSVSLYGTIVSGTIEDSGSGLTLQQNAELDGVTYRGTLAIDEGGFTIAGGIKLRNLAGNGPGEFDIGGPAQILFQGTQTLNNATIDLGDASYTASIQSDAATGSSATLTLGAGLTVIVGPNANIGGNGKVVNRGTMITNGAGDLDISSASFVNRGAITVANSDTVTVATGFTNDANVEIIQGLLDLQSTAGGTGNYQLDAAGTLEFDSTVGNGQIIKFYGSGGALQIGSANSFKAGAIWGFAEGDSIDLANVAFSGSLKMSYAGNANGGTLVVSDGQHTARLKLIGDYSAASFAAATDRGSGATITDTGSAGGDAALPSKLHRFTAAIAVHSADAARFGAVGSAHDTGDSMQRAVLAPSWHH
jgi:hypothetical protein